jgi:uncharacterized repeat protein (TIGR02543 family)
MKRYFALLSCLSLLFVFVFSGCETPTNETGIPSLTKVIISDSAANLANEIEQGTFTVGDTVYFSFSVTDSDLDIKQVVISQKSDDQTIDPVTLDLPAQQIESQVYIGEMNATYAGHWTIQAYLVDAKGNVSNTVTRNIIVNNIPPPLTYTVTYFGNGNDSGAAPVDTNEYANGSSAVVLGKGTLAKTGHEFLRWNTNPQGNGDAYNPDATMPINGDKSLYAIWNEVTYTVTFDTDGGSTVPSVPGVASGSKITRPDNPEKSGHTFDGWYKNTQYIEAWDFDNDVIADNTTLYAKWTPRQYTVSFYSDGVMSLARDVTAGDTVPYTSLEKSGYSLDGWYIDDQYHTAWDFDNNVVTGNIALYAKWTAIQHTVSFYSDGAILFSFDVAAGDTIAYRYLEKEGYYLGGWYIDDQYHTAWDFDNNVVTGNIALYAKWLNIPPGEVVITDCLYNVANNSIDVYYSIPGDIDLDHIIVYVDGSVYYDPVPTDYIAVYLYNISNGAVVTVKTVDTAGLMSNGVDHTVNIPGYTPTPNLLELVLSADVILKYPNRLDPPTISCSFETFINNEYVILHNLPTGWRLSLSTSAQLAPYMTWNGHMSFEEPIPIDRSWTWVEFKLYKGDILFDTERVLIVSDSP